VLELAAAAAKSPSAWDEPGTLGFLVVFGMAVILYFVFRSLAKHLRKINEAARLEAMNSGTGVSGTGASGTGASGAAASGNSAPGTETQSAAAQAGASGPERP
jgi:hypothetical protein